jgi:hypothetical protein
VSLLQETITEQAITKNEAQQCPDECSKGIFCNQTHDTRPCKSGDKSLFVDVCMWTLQCRLAAASAAILPWITAQVLIDRSACLADQWHELRDSRFIFVSPDSPL